ncbi:hypothetical protein [uncultured Leifsonia sp.]|uniref:hypothetical protein n=1 Tax=uncultured Leifsonia sp. TaxID=340359 RepID=UPI0025D95655|nr:hypothetical protein [uncultured Leifsonia sp.]
MGETTSATDGTPRQTSTSRRTLTWGGAGVALASLFPLLSNAGLVFPAMDMSWVFTSSAAVGGVSAVVLIASFVALALGVQGETGIAGTSTVGKAALVVFAVAHSTSIGYFRLPAPSAEADPAVLALWSTLIWGSVLLSLAALIVAATVVFRAGVVRGAARWALPAVVSATVIALLAGRIPSLAAIPIWIVALLASEVLQLATGVLYVAEGRRSRHAGGLRPASA